LKQIEKVLIRIITDIVEQRRRSRVSFGNATYIESEEENEVEQPEPEAQVEEEEQSPREISLPSSPELERSSKPASVGHSPEPTRVEEKAVVAVITETPRAVSGSKNEDVGVLKVGSMSYRLEGKITESHTTEDISGTKVPLYAGQRVR
jgi:hypothetical protein